MSDAACAGATPIARRAAAEDQWTHAFRGGEKMIDDLKKPFFGRNRAFGFIHGDLVRFRGLRPIDAGDGKYGALKPGVDQFAHHM